MLDVYFPVLISIVYSKKLFFNKLVPRFTWNTETDEHLDHYAQGDSYEQSCAFEFGEAGIGAIPSQRGRKEETELGGTALAAPTLRSGYAERACV